MREYQRHTTQWGMGKNFDRTGSIGPWMVTADELPRGGKGLKIESRLNGKTMQSSNTDNFMFPVAESLVYLTEGMTLEPGDILFTGTPSGVGHARKPEPVWMKPGDTIEVEVEGIGVLSNPIEDEKGVTTRLKAPNNGEAVSYETRNRSGGLGGRAFVDGGRAGLGRMAGGAADPRASSASAPAAAPISSPASSRSRCPNCCKQSVIVENKVGAGGTLAAELVARADKDGYTALMTSPAHTVSAAMLKSMRYDAVKDYRAGLLGRRLGLRLRREKGFRRQRHQGADRAGQGLARQAQFRRRRRRLDAELRRRAAAPDGRHRRQAHSLSQHAGRGRRLARGRSRLRRRTGARGARPGRGRPIEDSRGRRARRWPTLPNVPTVAESGVPGYSVVGWYGWLYPAGTPQAIVDKTNAALKEVLGRPEIREQLAKVGAVVHVSTPDEFAKHIADELAKWKAVREKAGIQQQ